MPSGPFAQIQADIRDLLHQSGWDGTVYNYTQDTSGGGDWYDDTGGGDAGWVEDSGTAITIRVEWGTAPEEVVDGSGREILGDAVIAVDPTEATFTDGGGEDDRASEIVDEDSGTRYRILRIRDEHHGVLILDCERL